MINNESYQWGSMSVRSHLKRYVVVGEKSLADGSVKRHREEFDNGRDAYIIESYLKREGYSNVRIVFNR